MPNPFETRLESVTGAPPVEVTKANDVVDYVKHAPGYYEAIAARAKREAEGLAEQIKLAPGFTDSLRDFAASQAAQVDRVREYGETFERLHAEKLRRIRDADPTEAMWDVDRNKD